MTAKYQIEALLRPAIEGTSAVFALLMALTIFLAHSNLLMPTPVALWSSSFFIAYALWRAWQWYRIKRYHRLLLRQPRYALKQNKIPVSRKALFLGKGFRWSQKHTQRLRDCLLPENEAYLREGTWYRRARNLELRFEGTTLEKLLSSQWVLNPVRPKPEVGGRPEIHGVGMYEGEQKVYLPLFERVGHTLVLGTTRVGKTRLAEVMATQDIARGETVIFFDPKGDADLVKSLYAAAREAGRLDNFYIFHLAYPEVSARYNPLGSYSRITEPATRIANGLPNEGNSAAFKEFGWRFTNIITRALHFLGKRPSYEAIAKYIDNIDVLLIEYGIAWLKEVDLENYESGIARIKYGLTGNKDDPNKPNVPALVPTERGRDMDAVCTARYLKQYMQETDQHEPVAAGLLSAFKYDKAYFDKIVSSLGPFLEKLTAGKVSELLSPDYNDLTDERPIFDWRDVIRTNGIVYVGLAALTDVTVASAVGNAMFSDLTAVAGDLYAHGTGSDAIGDAGYAKVSIHADEFNELIGDEFVPMLNKAGGAGYQVTAYTQTWADIEARIGSRAKAEQVGGNFNTLAMLRVLRTDTAEMLTDKLPKVQVNQITTLSAASHSDTPEDGTPFSSRVEDRITTADVPMIDPSDLTRLPKGQAFILKEGGQLFKVRLPLAVADDEGIPDQVRGLVENMRKDSDTRNSDTWYRDEWWQSTVGGAVNTRNFRDLVFGNKQDEAQNPEDLVSQDDADPSNNVDSAQEPDMEAFNG